MRRRGQPGLIPMLPDQVNRGALNDLGYLSRLELKRLARQAQVRATLRAARWKGRAL